MIKRILKKIFQQSRLKEYSSILDLAIEHGYIVTSLADWYENNFYPAKKVLVPGHDVDLSAKGALKMWLIEKNNLKLHLQTLINSWKINHKLDRNDDSHFKYSRFNQTKRLNEIIGKYHK
ncbi:MAG: hypothetical protein WC868_07960 [Bacteroidales bacterium]